MKQVRPKPRTRSFIIAFVVLLTLGLGLMQWNQVHHARLNRALIHAIQQGNAPAVQSLLGQGADPNTRQEIEPPPTIWQTLLAAFHNLRHRHQTPAPLPPTALIWAAYQGSPQVVQVLLDKGADVNAAGEYPEAEDSTTALLTAAQRFPANAAVVKMLLNKGARTDVQTGGNTPLMWICHGWFAARGLTPSEKNNDLLAMKLLLDKGANVNTRDTQGDGAVAAVTPEAGMGTDVAAAKLLLNRGANVNDRNDYTGVPVLMRAIHDPSFCSLLMEHGVDVNARDKHGLTPLMWTTLSADTGSLRTAKLLLDHGADVNAEDDQGATALIVAVGRDAVRLSMIKLLLSRGARVNDRDKHGWTALRGAVGLRNWQAAALLRKAGARE